MDTCEGLDETSLPDKKAFYSELKLKEVSDEDYQHAQKVFKDFNFKNIGECHDLYVQCNTLLLSDVFENFRNNCIEIYEFDPAHFLSAPGLACEACFKKGRSKIRIINRY